MEISELKSCVKTITSMNKLIEEQIDSNPQEVTNQALLSLSSYINNVILKNEGFQMDLFNKE